jgi:hypothetical protein
MLAAAGLLGLAGGTVSASSPPPVVPITLFPSDASGNRIVQPGYWKFTAAAGTKTKLYAVVGDPTHTATQVRVDPIDAADAIGGGLAYKLPTAPRKAVGSWVRLPKNSYHLDPKKGDVIGFIVSVPAGTKPGDYVGGVSAYVPNTKQQKQGNVAITVQPRIVTAVEVTVPGPRHSAFKAAGVKPLTLAGRQTYIAAHIKNTGNTLLGGTGYVWLYARGKSKPVIYQVLNISTSLAHSTVTFQIPWTKKKPAPGVYRWALKVNWNGGSSSTTGRFSIK